MYSVKPQLLLTKIAAHLLLFFGGRGLWHVKREEKKEGKKKEKRKTQRKEYTKTMIKVLLCARQEVRTSDFYIVHLTTHWYGVGVGQEGERAPLLLEFTRWKKWPYSG